MTIDSSEPVFRRSRGLVRTPASAATHMPTPCGPMPIPHSKRLEFASMTDAEIRKQALDNGTPFIDPMAFAEMLHRRMTP